MTPGSTILRQQAKIKAGQAEEMRMRGDKYEGERIDALERRVNRLMIEARVLDNWEAGMFMIAAAKEDTQ